MICFFGELAAGKTTLIKGLVHGAADYDPSLVQSPTFNYLNIYEGSKRICHFDLYRLEGPEDFFTMGFEEYLEQETICCIEWAERIRPCLYPNHVKNTELKLARLNILHPIFTIYLTHAGDDKRQILVAETYDS